MNPISRCTALLNETQLHHTEIKQQQVISTHAKFKSTVDLLKNIEAINNEIFDEAIINSEILIYLIMYYLRFILSLKKIIRKEIRHLILFKLWHKVPLLREIYHYIHRLLSLVYILLTACLMGYTKTNINFIAT